MVGKTMEDKSLETLRINYNKHQLIEQNIDSKPFNLFKLWMAEAKKSKIKEPNAMILSTIREQKPTARVVLLKGFDENGFVFYTNYQSHKGAEMAANPHASLTFFWDDLERQVRIEGLVSKVDPAVSDNYFQARPRQSQIGAWVSNQSSIIQGRGPLEEKNERLTEKFKDQEIIPRPPHWGGYIVKPSLIEFWQGRQSRLHDRILYTSVNGEWKTDRLSP